MAKYKKRPDGRYATSTIIGYTDDGKPKRKTLYGRTIMELDKKVAEFKSLQNKGIIINDEGITVQQWSEKWLELYKSEKEYNTYVMYKSKIDKYIIPFLGQIRLSALKKHHIQEMLNRIVKEGHLRTAELVEITIHQIIQQAIVEEYIYKDVSTGLELPQNIRPEKRALTESEKKYIKNADLTLKERVFVELLYYTGPRRGEALALMINDIDFVNKKLKINKNLVIKDGESEIKYSPKTDAGFRELPIPNKLLTLLQEYVLQLDSLYLFTQSTTNKLMTRSSFTRFWDNILDKINIAAGGTKYKRKDVSKKSIIQPLQVIADDITPHLFRHTYATNLYYAGVDIKTAQYLLGHSSIQMTLEIYTHLDNSNKVASAGDVLNSYFDNQENARDSQNIVRLRKPL